MSFYYPLPARLQCLYVKCDTANVVLFPESIAHEAVFNIQAKTKNIFATMHKINSLNIKY